MSLSLILAFLFGLLLPSAILLHFQVNRAEIARTRCVERFKPMEKNCCKGSCHLRKELKKAAPEGSKDPSAPRIETLELVALPPCKTIALVPRVAEMRFPPVRAALHSGHRDAVDHVPWLG
ncbi:MAG: hypothetical protein H6591_03570 [Flavobacteriales bacterium]|nr:hypothetical protein [Flavobacteriales bacterium]